MFKKMNLRIVVNLIILISTYSMEILTKGEMYKRGHMKPFGSHRHPLHVEEMKFMISPEDFYMNFVARHTPVVFKNVTKQWPAYHLWSDDYLAKNFGDTEMNMETKDDDKINIPQSRLLKDFLKVYKDSNLYMVDEVIPAMRKDVILPLCLRCEEMDRFFFVAYYWHSNGETMSTVHIDTDENLLCVISGHKKVLLVSPIYSNDLYADDARQMGVLDVNASAIDLDKYPRMMNVEYHEAIVEEGDCVYIPQMWWHQVHSRNERQQAIAMWWKSKPYWKDLNNMKSPENGNKESTSRLRGQSLQKHSYAESLIEYENWVQDASHSIPRLKCTEQHVKMSDYHWETDKVKEAPMSLGDGGNVEEEVFNKKNMASSEEIRDAIRERIHRQKQNENNPDLMLTDPFCDFDVHNKKSPCYYTEPTETTTTEETTSATTNPTAAGVASITKSNIATPPPTMTFEGNKGIHRDEDIQFVRYVMDYCAEFEDRGCVIQKPQILNKLWRDEFQHMAFTMTSSYRKRKGEGLHEEL